MRVSAPGPWLLVALGACTGEAVQLPLGGAGQSSVVLLAEGAFAVDRRAVSTPIPAIPLADISAGVVFALDYAVPLADLAIPRGALVDDATGGVLPTPSAARQLQLVDGEAGWVTIDRRLVDGARAFRGLPRPAERCADYSVTPVVTATLAGEPRALHNAGAQHLWLGIAGQPLRAVDLETGAISLVALDGAGDAVAVSSGAHGRDVVWTVRVRDGRSRLEMWGLDPARPGQVMPTPLSSVPLPDGDYRWMVDWQVQEQGQVYLLAREGLWLHFDGRAVSELARWTSGLGEPAYGAVTRSRDGDAAAVLSDTSRVRWRLEGDATIHEAFGQGDAVMSAAYVLSRELVVGGASGSLWWLRGGSDWRVISRRALAEPVRAMLHLSATQFLTFGQRGAVASWRIDGGWCDPLVLPGGPEIVAVDGSALRQMIVARLPGGEVKLYWIDLAPR